MGTELSFSKNFFLNLIFYLCKLTLAINDIIIWNSFDIEIRRWITLDETLPAKRLVWKLKNDLISFLENFSCDNIIWSRSFFSYLT